MAVTNKRHAAILAAMKSIEATYPEQVENERARWGDIHAEALEEQLRSRHIPAYTIWEHAKITPNYRTLWAMQRMGLITVDRVQRSHSYLRRGAYGRWIGGTEAHVETTLHARLTDIGRQEQIATK